MKLLLEQCWQVPTLRALVEAGRTLKVRAG